MEFRLTVVQAAAFRGNPPASRRRYDRILEGLRTDLVLLPELALTGYDPTLDYDRLAETVEGDTARWASGWARRLDALVGVGFPLAEGGRTLNALLLAHPDGGLSIHRKRHLWGGETGAFTAGKRPVPVLEHRGVRLATLICYDMTFPGETAPLAGRIDLLLVPSAWPWMSTAHAAAGPDLVRALATQLQAAVAWANQVGACRTGTPEAPSPDRGAGRSLVTLPYRAAEACCPARGTASATLTVDVEALRRRRAAKFGPAPDHP